MIFKCIAFIISEQVIMISPVSVLRLCLSVFCWQNYAETADQIFREILCNGWT